MRFVEKYDLIRVQCPVSNNVVFTCSKVYETGKFNVSNFSFQVMERTFRTMGLHPKYLEAFRVAHDKLVYCDGPISSTDRHYIALMVGRFFKFSRHLNFATPTFCQESKK